MSFNQFFLDTAADQGWLTTEQMQELAEGLSINEAFSVTSHSLDMQWMSQEQTTWIQQQYDQAASESGEATAEPTEEIPDATAANAEGESVAPVYAQGTSIEGFNVLANYLKYARDSGASDVCLSPFTPPVMRLHGQLQPFWAEAPPLAPEATEHLLMAVLSPSQKEIFNSNGDIDFCYDDPAQGRFRASVVRQRLGVEGVFRIVSDKVRTLEDLGLPAFVKGLTKFHNGLVLVTGPVGSGKTTTLAALVQEVNQARHDHIITLEDPIEYVFESAGCQITQREVRTHTDSFAAALRGALREDPDVIMVGDMRDLETISLAITASETGHLVFGALHTSSAGRTLDRILDAFPTEQQGQIRTMVAGSLRGIVSQQLVPRADGKGRALALEILINTPAAASLIRDGKTYMLNGVMQTGKKIGCRLMDDSLMDLLVNDVITAREAYERADQKGPFKEFLNN
ncbi:MAG: PilT/PilU family type 4a pilus ATPase [Verrucomicrobiota bacterium]|nr:PilT/PilU family type 4a pilus ATPase [Verrucomicrobiota bacterium]